MKLYGLLVVVVAVHGADHNPDYSQVEYTGSGCPSSPPESCTNYSAQLAKMTTFTNDDWHALTEIGMDCRGAVNSDTCTAKIEVGLSVVSKKELCQSHLGYIFPQDFLTEDWQVRQARGSGVKYPACAETRIYGTKIDNLCSSITRGTPVEVTVDGNVVYIKDYNPTRSLVFWECGFGAELTVVVELITERTTTTLPPTTESTTAEGGESSPVSTRTDEPADPNDKTLTEEPEKPGTNPEKPGTDPEGEIVTEEPDFTQSRAVPGSATRSAVLSVVPLAIIGAIY